MQAGEDKGEGKATAPFHLLSRGGGDQGGTRLEKPLTLRTESKPACRANRGWRACLIGSSPRIAGGCPSSQHSLLTDPVKGAKLLGPWPSGGARATYRRHLGGGVLLVLARGGERAPRPLDDDPGGPVTRVYTLLDVLVLHEL